MRGPDAIRRRRSEGGQHGVPGRVRGRDKAAHHLQISRSAALRRFGTPQATRRPAGPRPAAHRAGHQQEPAHKSTPQHPTQLAQTMTAPGSPPWTPESATAAAVSHRKRCARVSSDQQMGMFEPDVALHKPACRIKGRKAYLTPIFGVLAPKPSQILRRWSFDQGLCDRLKHRALAASL
jgi:hypothetical protein